MNGRETFLGDGGDRDEDGGGDTMEMKIMDVKEKVMHRSGIQKSGVKDSLVGSKWMPTGSKHSVHTPRIQGSQALSLALLILLCVHVCVCVGVVVVVSFFFLA